VKGNGISMIQKIRGTMDILPEEIAYWHFIENTARETAALFGYSEMRVPTFEATELFLRGVGDTTDVVQKEMYTFSDREGRSITLRPEGTAGIARAIIENGKCSDTMPMRLYYLINCFRYEKPQAGRSREFYQFGAEVFGSASATADAAVIAFANTVINRIGIKGVELNINSIGCEKCRPDYHAELVKYFRQNSDKLCPTCLGRLETNPLRILDCKNPECKELCADAPKTVDSLCPECKDHFELLKKCLDAYEIKHTVNPMIVRGLDYYTRTVFEFICPEIGAQSTICGGGRYDGLISQLGGPAIPGIGFAMGLTRLILAMKACGVEVPSDAPMKLYVASMGEAAAVKAAEMVGKLRMSGIPADCDMCGRSLKAQMKYADKTNAEYTLIVGDSEIESGRAVLKCMSDSTQNEVSINDVDEIIKYIS